MMSAWKHWGKVMRRQAIREQDLVSSRRSTGPCSCARSSVAVVRGGPVRLMRLRPVECLQPMEYGGTTCYLQSFTAVALGLD